MILAALAIFVIVAVVVGIILYTEVNHLAGQLDSVALDLKNQAQINRDLNTELQIESVKAAYALNQFEKLEQDVIFAQHLLIDTEVKLNKMTAEYLELQNVFAETLVEATADATGNTELIAALDAAEYVQPYNYQAEE